MNITFRTDSSYFIGTGHVRRCLNLAEELRRRGETCAFICREYRGSLIDAILKAGFKVHVLPNPHSYSKGIDCIRYDEKPTHASWLGADWHTDAKETINCLNESKTDWLIVDHYGIDYRWESRIRFKTVKIMVIDDLADRLHDCDILLDQNLVENLKCRYTDLVPSRCVKLLGPKYALINTTYANLRAHTPPRKGPIKRILVSFGGTDTYNITGMTVESLCEIGRKDVFIDVVLSPDCPFFTDVKSLIASNPNINLHERLPNLARLMAEADLAIGAVGITTWERCCLGLPSIVITIAENQVPIAEMMSKSNYLTWLGDHRNVSKTKIRAILESYLSNTQTENISVALSVLVDGLGVQRVTDILTLNGKSNLRIREATVDDEELLLNWVNDPLVRKNSFQTTQIKSEEHNRWFRARLNNACNCKIFIIETEMAFPIGQVRFDLGDLGWELDYSLSSIARGKKLSKKILALGIEFFAKVTKGISIERLFAKVKASNAASRAAIEANGFSPVECNSTDFVIYYRPMDFC